MNFADQLRHTIDHKTKPIGSLGLLEALAFQIAALQGTLTPVLRHPSIVVFAGDHGLAAEGVSAYPSSVTAQMVFNFLGGGAAINVFCRQHGIDLRVVDAGVAASLPAHASLRSHPAGAGTANSLLGPAMTEAQWQHCLRTGAGAVASLHPDCNVVGFGEMGIGNTASASILMSAFCDLAIEDCVGRGTGLDDAGLAHKTMVLKKVQECHSRCRTTEEWMQAVAGFEMAAMTGAFLEAARQGKLVLVDGFIATAAYLAAERLDPSIRRCAVFTHLSDERAHAALLHHLGAKPLLQLGLRLGEGTGCALAYPLMQSAVAFLCEMASFESAGVDQKTEA